MINCAVGCEQCRLSTFLLNFWQSHEQYRRTRLKRQTQNNLHAKFMLLKIVGETIHYCFLHFYMYKDTTLVKNNEQTNKLTLIWSHNAGTCLSSIYSWKPHTPHHQYHGRSSVDSHCGAPTSTPPPTPPLFRKQALSTSFRSAIVLCMLFKNISNK